MLIESNKIVSANELTSELKQISSGFQDANYILSYVSIAPLLISIASACFCLGCSAVFHLYYVQSPSLSDILSRLDYGGISVLIFGSALPIIYYSFACEPEST